MQQLLSSQGDWGLNSKTTNDYQRCVERFLSNQISPYEGFYESGQILSVFDGILKGKIAFWKR